MTSGSWLACGGPQLDTIPAPTSYELAVSIPHGMEAIVQRGTALDPATAWIALFDRATSRIDLGQFYVASTPGTALEPVLDALERAGQRGVRIRFLADARMMERTALDDLGGRDRLARIPNIELRQFSAAQTVGGVHHAKYLIVDDAVVYLGSQNFDWRAIETIHEVGVATDDRAVVQSLTAIFAHDWRTTEQGDRTWWDVPPIGIFPITPSDRARIVASPPPCTPYAIPDAEGELIATIARARQSIAVEVMSMRMVSPDGQPYLRIAHALRDAAWRGVDVRVLLDRSKVSGDLAELRSLAFDGVTVRAIALPQPWPVPYAWLVHAKTMVVDDEVLWIGTSNWSAEYFDRSRNVELVLNDAALAAQTLTQYHALWSSPFAVDITTIPDPPPSAH